MVNKDHDRAAPFYIQVAQTIRSRIMSDLYQPGQLIPTAKELEDEFGVSNITIRKAVEILTRDGLLIGRRGVGTMVAEREEALIELSVTGDFRQWFDSTTGLVARHEVTVLEMGPTNPCPPRPGKVLGLDAEETVWRMRRVRRHHGDAVSYYINYLPPELGRGITEEEITKKSFVEVFQAVSGVRLARLRQRVRAATADMDLSGMLDIQFGEPVFDVEVIYYDVEDNPTEVTQIYFRGDKYVYQAVIDL